MNSAQTITRCVCTTLTNIISQFVLVPIYWFIPFGIIRLYVLHSVTSSPTCATFLKIFFTLDLIFLTYVLKREIDQVPPSLNSYIFPLIRARNKDSRTRKISLEIRVFTFWELNFSITKRIKYFQINGVKHYLKLISFNLLQCKV